jgi:hypothetical protein
VKPVVEFEWRAAVEDAQLDIDTLHVFEIESSCSASGMAGFHQSPGPYNPQDETILAALSPIEAELAADENRHRIVVWSDNGAPVVAALLRHELEHAWQWERHGDAAGLLHQALKPALMDKAGGRGFGHLNNLSPLEMDANAAAARFAWSRHDDVLRNSIDTIPECHQALFRYRGGPEPLDTLPQRIIEYGHLFAARCEAAAAEEGLVFADVLDQRWPGGGRLWNQLSNAQQT